MSDHLLVVYAIYHIKRVKETSNVSKMYKEDNSFDVDNLQELNNTKKLRKTSAYIYRQNNTELNVIIGGKL